MAVWAYAYEVENDSLVPDAKFDEICREVDTAIATDRPDLDKWFRSAFSPSTGMWVRQHPEIERLAAIYRGIKQG